MQFKRFLLRILQLAAGCFPPAAAGVRTESPFSISWNKGQSCFGSIAAASCIVHDYFDFLSGVDGQNAPSKVKITQ